MLSTARRGAVALRSLRFTSLSTAGLPALRSTRSQGLPQVIARNAVASKQFSSISRYFQSHALAEEPEESAPEFTKFEELGQSGVISPTVIETITKNMNIHTMTEVQRMTLNQCLGGEDVIAQARTGTGKTIAFLLPIIQRIIRNQPHLEDKYNNQHRHAGLDIKGLIISPTRELAEQIAVEAQKLTANTGIKVHTAVGGTQKQYHLRIMKQTGCHLLIGTPGRVNDILSDPTTGVNLDNIQTFVLDEADRLLDIGFAPAIEEIQSYMPKGGRDQRQTLMFSATVPKSVVDLVRQTMRPDFKFVRTVDPGEAPTHERVPQNVVFLDGLQNQPPAILEIAMKAIEAHKQDPVNNMPFKAIVYYGSTNEVDMAFDIFSSMQDPTNSSPGRRYAPHPLEPTKLFRMNGKLDQRVRTRESQGFRRAESAILFSSDVTARGMDFPNVSHVIQLGLPRQTDDYIHRIGRTGRAGKSGEGWLLLNQDERSAYRKKMSHPGLKMKEIELPTASLNMTQPAQLPASVARLLQIVETGVKNVPYNTKRSVYQSLLGVLPQQFPDRSKQAQIDMMNELARYGWGMQTPPPLPRPLLQKLGYDRCQGIEIEEGYERRERDQPRDQSRGSSRRNVFDDKDPFGLGQSGKGVFGGQSSGRDSFGSRGSRGGDSRGRSYSDSGRDGGSNRAGRKRDRFDNRY